MLQPVVLLTHPRSLPLLVHARGFGVWYVLRLRVQTWIDTSTTSSHYPKNRLILQGNRHMYSLCVFLDVSDLSQKCGSASALAAIASVTQRNLHNLTII